MSRSQPDLQLSQLSQVEVAIPIDQITSKKFHQFLTALRARRRMTGRVSQLHHHICRLEEDGIGSEKIKSNGNRKGRNDIHVMVWSGQRTGHRQRNQ